MVRRAGRFFESARSAPRPRRLLLARSEAQIPAKSRFTVPDPVAPSEKLTRISVTRFKVYLACPYRYYLRHVCRLEAIDDTARELDGSAFGNLLHETLSGLGRDPAAPRESTRPQELFDYLNQRWSACRPVLWRK